MLVLLSLHRKRSYVLLLAAQGNRMYVGVGYFLYRYLLEDKCPALTLPVRCILLSQLSPITSLPKSKNWPP